MSIKKIHTGFLNDADLPADIPSVDKAWSDMRQKLDKDKSNKKPVIFWSLLSIALVCMLGGLILFTKMHSNEKTDAAITDNKNNNHQEGSAQVEKSSTDVSGKDSANYIPKQNEKNNTSLNKQNIISSLTASQKHPVSREQNTEDDLKQQIAENHVKTNDADINPNTFINETSADKQPQVTAAESAAKKLYADSSSTAENNQIDSASKIQIIQKPKATILAGLQWNAQIPFAGVDGYFAGPNAKAQPYRILLPGIWVSMLEGKSIFTIEANLFHTAAVPQKLFFTGVSSKVNEDTAIITSETKALSRLFGFSAAFGYNHNIKNNWWLGGNMQFVSWNKGVVNSTGTIEKKSMSGSFETTTNTFSTHHPITDTEKASFYKSQFIANAEWWYRKDMWQAGLRTGISVTPLANQKGPSNSFRTDIMFRIALWNSLKEK